MPNLVILVIVVAIGFAVVRILQCWLESACVHGTMPTLGRLSPICRNPVCGHANQPHAQFCSRCGSPLGDNHAAELRRH